MAITGKFAADFAAFYDACQKAEVHLKSFEENSNKVGAALDRATNALSGTRIVQQATIAAEAVERIGGVSKLTDAELARVGATAQEAANKLRAMGQDVPPGIQKIADAAKEADTAHRTLGSTVKDLALGFAALFTARAAYNFAKDVVADASALKDLSQQTHINVGDLQILSGAMSEFGVDADVLGKGLYTLSRKVAGGDESVAKALGVMGMSLQDVAGLNGQELFLKIEDGLATLQGGLRDDTSADIFGSRLGMAMAGASEGIRGAMATWREHNTLMSGETVEALDKYDEAIKRAEKSLSSLAANMIGPVAEGFNTLIGAAEKGASKWAIFWAVTQDWATSIPGATTNASHLATLLDHLNQQTEKNVTATVAVKVAHEEAAVAIHNVAAETLMATEREKALKQADDELAAAMKSHWGAVGTILDRVFGVDALKAASQWEDAINTLGGSVSRLAHKDLADLEAAMLAGIDALARTGQLTSEASSRYAALAIQARQLNAAEVAVVASTDTYAKSLLDEAAAQDAALSAMLKANVALEQQYALKTAVSDVLSRGNVSFPGETIDAAYIEAHKFDFAFQQAQIDASLRNANAGRLPSFSSGGPVTSDGPIYAHAGEYVSPKGGGTGVTNIYVNGVFGTVQQVTDAVSAALVAKSGRKF